MSNNKKLVDINQLFNHWMTQIETNDHYKELTKDEIERIQQNSKDHVQIHLSNNEKGDTA